MAKVPAVSTKRSWGHVLQPKASGTSTWMHQHHESALPWEPWARGSCTHTGGTQATLSCEKIKQLLKDKLAVESGAITASLIAWCIQRQGESDEEVTQDSWRTFQRETEKRKKLSLLEGSLEETSEEEDDFPDSGRDQKRGWYIFRSQEVQMSTQNPKELTMSYCH